MTHVKLLNFILQAYTSEKGVATSKETKAGFTVRIIWIKLLSVRPDELKFWVRSKCHKVRPPSSLSVNRVPALLSLVSLGTPFCMRVYVWTALAIVPNTITVYSYLLVTLAAIIIVTSYCKKVSAMVFKSYKRNGYALTFKQHYGLKISWLC